MLAGHRKLGAVLKLLQLRLKFLLFLTGVPRHPLAKRPVVKRTVP
jgi:hypothetical protein